MEKLRILVSNLHSGLATYCSCLVNIWLLSRTGQIRRYMFAQEGCANMSTLELGLLEQDVQL